LAQITAEASSSGLTHGMMVPSLSGIRLGPEFRWALSARILQIWMSISALSSLAEKEWLGQLGPGYIHIVASRHRRGRMRRLTKVHTHQSGLLAADEQPRAWVVACRCPAEPHHTPSWVGGQLPVNTMSGTSVLLLRKNHSFWHPTGGLDIERHKYRSIPCPD
jgi:hypothetical protein